MLMAMEPERSRSSSPSTTTKPLHNFTMPCGLRWGNQKFLRCMKVNSNGEISTIERRSLSSSSSSIANKAVMNGGSNVLGMGSNDSKSITGKRKEREKFEDPQSVSRTDQHHRRGSDCRKPGFNFKLPPLPIPSSQRPSSSATEFCRKYRSPETGGRRDGEGDGIAAVRKKLMIDLQTAADQMKVAILREGLETEEQDIPPSPSPAPATAPTPTPTVPTTVTSSETADASVRPWNLRTRRAACKEPTTTTATANNGFVSGSTSNGGTNATAPPSKALALDGIKPNSSSSPSRAENNKKSVRLRSGVATAADAAAPKSPTKERVKFSVSLTRREIEEDFLTLANRRPARRPQKRDRNVQRELDVSKKIEIHRRIPFMSANLHTNSQKHLFIFWVITFFFDSSIISLRLILFH